MDRLASAICRGLLVGVAVFLVALDPGGTGAAAASSDAPRKLRILVTNNDGVHSEGLDVAVEVLREVPKVSITVVAPATDQTSTGNLTTEGEVSASKTRTLSGFPAISVEGFSADSVNHALTKVMKKSPHVVVSGINRGENLGPIVDSSGTIGAARAAHAHGIPSLAVSQGLAAEPPYEIAAAMAIDWLQEHRDEFIAKRRAPRLESLNVPTCTSGTIRGLVRVPIARGSAGLGDPPNCASTLTDPTDDVAAFLNGFATLSRIPPTPRGGNR